MPTTETRTMNRYKVRLYIAKLFLLSICAIASGSFVFFKSSTLPLESTLHRENIAAWPVYALGCFLIRVPEDKSVVYLLTYDDQAHFEILSKFQDEEEWDEFLKGSRHDQMLSIQVASFLHHFIRPISGEPITIGGLKGHHSENESDNMISGKVQLWAPSPYYKGKLDITISYQNLSREEKHYVDDIIQTVRFDTTQYLDGDTQNHPPQVKWLFEPPASDDLGPFDLAFEIVPVHDVTIQHKFPWPGKGLECLSPGVRTQSKRAGELLEQHDTH